jgi:hypothetical protein
MLGNLFNLDRLLELLNKEMERTDAAEESLNGDISSGPELSSAVTTKLVVPWSVFSNLSLLADMIAESRYWQLIMSEATN